MVPITATAVMMRIGAISAYSTVRPVDGWQVVRVNHPWPPSCGEVGTGDLGAGSPSPTWLTTSSIAGLMTLSTGCGKNPSPTISTIAGASEAISRG